MRHAKADQKNDPVIEDFERPLNRRGANDAAVMAKRFSESEIHVDALVSSPAVRAKTTADAFAAELKLPVQTDPRIYAADVMQLQETVRGLDDHLGSAVLFGHNPGFSDFLRYLTEEPYNDLPTAGIAVINLPLKSWKHTYAGKGTLRESFCPKEETIGFQNRDPRRNLIDRFRFWRFQRAQRLELIIAFAVGLLLLALLIPLIMRRSIDSSAAPRSGSEGSLYIERAEK